MEPDALRLVQRLNHAADLGPHHAFQRQRLRRDDVDLDLRARNDAATSNPMKLAPITTARLPASARSTIALLSLNERR